MHVEDVIKHIIALCTHPPVRKSFVPEALGGQPIEKFKSSTLYELRLLEEDDDEGFYYAPLYDIGPLDRQKFIGEIATDGVAMCRVKDFYKRISKQPESM